MNISSKTSKQVDNINSFVNYLRKDFPEFNFKRGTQDHWSPKTNTITYKSRSSVKKMLYSLLHELAHAKLMHTNYHSDFELLKLEAAAWDLAAKIGRKYKIQIDNNHIQNCLDTYRDWLHARSACPTCTMNVLQKDPYHYYCFNCQTKWKVTSGQFVRPYRQKVT